MNSSTESLAMPAATSRDTLTDIILNGAHRLLAQAIDAEVATWIENHKHVVDADGHRAVVRNGHMPTRSILTGVGTVQVTQPRVHNRRPEDTLDGNGLLVERFRSKILPPYLRKTKSIEEFIPWLYLKGVSTGDFTEALGALLGPLRHRKTKGSGSRKACLAMVFKLMECASKTWRALNGSALMPDVIAGIQFVDGEKKNAA